MVTIYDIAKKVNVSASTVSKALSDKPDINKETKAKILKIAKSLKYTPNLQARGLKTKQSHLIGVLYIEDTALDATLDHPVFLPLLDNLKYMLEKDSYELIFLSPTISTQINRDLLAHCKARQLDGVIAINLCNIDKKELSNLNSEIPFVVVNQLVPDFSCVLTDNFMDSYNATLHLISLGCKKIVFVEGPISPFEISLKERFLGYKKALKENKIKFNENLVIKVDSWKSQAGETAVRQLINKKISFDAIFFTADRFVLGALPLLEKENFNVGKDIAIVGFDGATWAPYVASGLSTMQQDTNAIAKQAIQILFDKIKDNKIKEKVVKVPAKLVIRSSSKNIKK